MASRLIHVLWILILFEMGVLLLILPWVGIWDSNFFLTQYPSLRPLLLHPSLRGAITGLGALDIVVAAGMLRRRSPAAP